MMRDDPPEGETAAEAEAREREAARARAEEVESGERVRAVQERLRGETVALRKKYDRLRRR